MPVLRMALLMVLCASAWGSTSLAYLESADPYYVSLDFPKFTAQQWIGEEGVDAVLVLSIDDMRDHQKYETYLRPILDRLKEIDGRAPVSILTCEVVPGEPHLQKWLAEGLSLDAHTAKHPCPLLGTGSFDESRATYEDCITQLNQVPNSRPVAYRMPCCDSLNTPSPRFYAEIFNKATAGGHFLAMDSSVFNITTDDDPALPKRLTRDDDGKARFRKYLPFPSFVNTIENYPYPYIIGKLCWELPCTVPSDWEAQNLNEPNSPASVADMKAAIDATVLKNGVYVLVFHPHGWIENTQVADLVDYADEQYGERVRFMNFPEILARIEQNALGGHSIRHADGGDNGVRLIDLNLDGYMDVVIANDRARVTRVWNPTARAWDETTFPVTLVSRRDGEVGETGVRFGWGHAWPGPIALVHNEETQGAWVFKEGEWHKEPALLGGLSIGDQPVHTVRDGHDDGVRFHDLDGDGQAELIVANPSSRSVFAWQADRRSWRSLPIDLPPGDFVDSQGRDGGLRLVDLDSDGDLDWVVSNEAHYAVYRFEDLAAGWAKTGPSGSRTTEAKHELIPPIVVNGENRGAWFHSGKLWFQNEETGDLPDHVDRRSFEWLLGQGEKQ